MKNVKKMIQAGLKKFTVITILGVFLMTSLIPVSAATKVSKIKWSAYRKTMYVGNAQRFAVKITPAKASKAKLGWKTSNKKIAKVSTKGVVTPVKAGKATITCYVKSQKSKKVTCKVTVKKQKVTAITFAKASVAVQKGKKVSNPAIVPATPFIFPKGNCPAPCVIVSHGIFIRQHHLPKPQVLIFWLIQRQHIDLLMMTVFPDGRARKNPNPLPIGKSDSDSSCRAGSGT